MKTLAAMRTRGPAWDEAQPTERQADRDAHPWVHNGLLVLKQVAPWQIRLGSPP